MAEIAGSLQIHGAECILASIVKLQGSGKMRTAGAVLFQVFLLLRQPTACQPAGVSKVFGLSQLTDGLSGLSLEGKPMVEYPPNSWTKANCVELFDKSKYNPGHHSSALSEAIESQIIDTFLWHQWIKRDTFEKAKLKRQNKSNLSNFHIDLTHSTDLDVVDSPNLQGAA